jgi:hypothetical protein
MIDLQWDNAAQTILRWDMRGKWTWDEVYPMVDTTNQWIGIGQQSVVVVMNPTDEITYGGYAPPNSISHLVSVSQRLNPLWVQSIFVTTASVGRVIINTAMQLNPRLRGRYLAVNTLDEARVAALARLTQP